MPAQMSHANGRREISGKRFYQPELDVLRFAAFFSVFLAHLERAPVDASMSAVKVKLIHAYTLMTASGAFGMCIFFLLSAYLITELLLRERASTGHVHLRAFYTRRILRIWPLYFGVVFAGYFVGLALPEYRLSGTWVLAFVLLAGNWYTGKVDYAPSTVGALWSISLEEQFYLLWPGIAKVGGRRALAYTAIFTIPLGFGVLFYLCGKSEPMQPSLWTNSFVQFPFFGIGALLALLLHGRSFCLPTALRPLLFVGGWVLWLVANHTFHVNGVYYEARPVSVCIGFALVAVGCIGIFLSLLGMRRSLLPPSLVYLGKISYGLYVFHVPCREIAHWLLGGIRHALLIQPVVEMALTIAIAILSYRYFEKAFLRLKERFEFVPSRTT